MRTRFWDSQLTRERAEKVYEGMKLFLYDVDLKLMYGIYKIAGNGGFSIEPKAFKSRFPSQVRFSIVDDCSPLPEEKFREVIKKNYYTKTKFDCKLTSEQVKNLCKLFISASKTSGIQLKSETSSMDSSKNNRQHMDKNRQPEHVQQTKWAEEPRYYTHPHLLERNVVTTPLLPLAWAQNSLPLAAGQSHNRTLENSVYGCDTMTHNCDTSREGPLVEPCDSYGQDKLLNPDIYRGEALADHYDYHRQDRLVYNRESKLVHFEAGFQDVVNHHPYALYSENLSSQDPVYSPGRHPKYNPPPGLRREYHLGGLSSEYSSTRGVPPESLSSPGRHPKCNPPPGLRPEYRLGGLSSEYSSTRGVPPESHSSPGRHPKCNPPPGLRPEYRLGGLSSEYSSSRGVPPEYHSSPGRHPKYNPPPGLQPEYRLGGLSSEYSSTRGVPPEYHSSPGRHPKYNPPPGLRLEYRLGGLSSEYSSSRGVPPEYHSSPGRHPKYNPPPGLRPEYRLGGLSSEYSSTRGVPPEYHSSPGRHPKYISPPGLRPEYHLGGLSSEYSSTRGVPPEYHSSPNSLPEFNYHYP